MSLNPLTFFEGGPATTLSGPRGRVEPGSDSMTEQNLDEELTSGDHAPNNGDVASYVNNLDNDIPPGSTAQTSAMASREASGQAFPPAVVPSNENDARGVPPISEGNTDGIIRIDMMGLDRQLHRQGTPPCPCTSTNISVQ
jgi:hypothetical protein